MRLRKVKKATEKLEESRYVLKEIKDIHHIFPNKKPIHLEIGSGKGKFLVEKALKNPNINFIGLEKKADVLVKALDKIDEEIENLIFICDDARNVNVFFNKKIEVLYLNFSDPWPKKRHEQRRLTSDFFLKNYQNWFRKKITIFLKTDNSDFFDYSIEQFKKYNYNIKKISYSLITENIDNVMTEYEEKFVNMNQPIYYVALTKK